MKRISLYKFYLLTLCFFVGTIASFSQTQDAEWTAESYLVTINEVDVEITSHLSKQDTTFTWEQVGYNNTTDTNTFTITSTTGNWSAQNNIGELNYGLSSEGLLASVTVNGTTEGITIVLVINSTTNSIEDHYAFYIDSFTNL